jgi:hypothetical protein
MASLRQTENQPGLPSLLISLVGKKANLLLHFITRCNIFIQIDDMKDEWLVFSGDVIKNHLIKKRGSSKDTECSNGAPDEECLKKKSSSDYAKLLNVSPAAFSRWLDGSITPCGPAIFILAIFLLARKNITTQRQRPAWWQPEGQCKRRSARKRTAVSKKCSNARKHKKGEDLFQYARLANGLINIAISPSGLDEVKRLAIKLCDIGKLVETLRPEFQRPPSHSAPSQGGQHGREQLP